MEKSPTTPPRDERVAFSSWATSQILSFLSLLTKPVIGPVLLMARRQFCFKACLCGFLVMSLGTTLVVAVLAIDPLGLGTRRHEALWPLVLLVLTLAGFATGKVARGVGGFESYVALLFTTAIFFVHLAKGWHVILAFGGTDTLSAWDLATRQSLGERYFGEFWTRSVALVASSGLVLAIFGGSLAFVLFGDDGRADTRFGYEWFISRRHLGNPGHKTIQLTTLVSLIGIALGVAALVAVTSVMSGYQQEIRDKLLSTNPHLIIQKYGVDFVEHAKIESKIRATTEGIEAASPFVFNEAMLSHGAHGLTILIKGVDPKTAGTVTHVEQNLCVMTREGTCARDPAQQQDLRALLAPQGAQPGIVLGLELLRKAGLEVGDQVLLTTPVGVAMARGNAPRRLQFRVTGAFRSGIHEFDSRLAYLELGTAQHLLGMGEAVTGLELKVSNPDGVDLIAKAALDAIGRYPYRALDWRELNATIFTALNLQKIVMFLVLTFIVIVAAFNIASTLFMAVVERAHEIAVLKSMGARDASILKIFVVQGWIVGVLGTALGVLLGLLLCVVLAEANLSIAADVYMVDSLEVRVRPAEIAVVVLATLVIAHLASIYPALKAARERPVDAMRYE